MTITLKSVSNNQNVIWADGDGTSEECGALRGSLHTCPLFFFPEALSFVGWEGQAGSGAHSSCGLWGPEREGAEGAVCSSAGAGPNPGT